jgi:hypothetical protein
MKKLESRQWLVVLAFVLVISFTGLFAVRTVRRAIYWRYHQDETIRPWMSVGYVAHSYRVPPWVLHQALGLAPGPDRRPIRELARAQQRSEAEVIAILQNAIVHSRPPYPRPPDRPPDDLHPSAIAPVQIGGAPTQLPSPNQEPTTDLNRGRRP